MRSEDRFTAVCPPGTLMIGLDLRTTYAFVSVRARCLPPLQIYGATSVPGLVQLSTLAGYGSKDVTDGWQRVECPPGSVLSGFESGGVSGGGSGAAIISFDGLALECRSLEVP